MGLSFLFFGPALTNHFTSARYPRNEGALSGGRLGRRMDAANCKFPLALFHYGVILTSCTRGIIAAKTCAACHLSSSRRWHSAPGFYSNKNSRIKCSCIESHSVLFVFVFWQHSTEYLIPAYHYAWPSCTAPAHRSMQIPGDSEKLVRMKNAVEERPMSCKRIGSKCADKSGEWGEKVRGI